MKLIVYIDAGCEAFAAKECAHYGLTPVVHEQFLVCEAELYDLLRIAIRLQTALQCSVVVDKITDFLTAKDGFSVKNARESIVELAKSTGAKVRLRNPSQVLREVVVDDQSLICVDISPVALYKREYKVFNNPASLRATIAASALWCGQFSNSLVDPFCGGGTLCLEAATRGMLLHERQQYSFPSWPCTQDFDFTALFAESELSDVDILGFDWNITAVKSAQKNAQIAQVADRIEFVRYEASFLAHKREEASCIVTHPPHFSSKDYGNKVAKHIALFFEQVSEVLTGRCVVVTNDDHALLEIDHGLTHIATYPVQMGGEILHFVVFEQP